MWVGGELRGELRGKERERARAGGDQETEKTRNFRHSPKCSSFPPPGRRRKQGGVATELSKTQRLRCSWF